MNSPLVVFGEDWGAHPSSTQHLIHCLMQDRDVVWVNSIGLRRPRLSVSDLKRAFKKGLSAFSQKKQTENLITPKALISPLVIPVPQNTVERTINRISMGYTIKKALSNLQNKRPILWTSLPTAVDFLGSSNERTVVYYCGDDFSSLAGVDHKQVSQAEEKLVDRADLILAASHKMVRKFPKSKTVYLPHGVDVDLFSTPCPAPDDLPTNRPVAGFYGSISDWMDVELLSDIANLLPNWAFVLIGNIHTDVSALQALKNVHFLGPKQHKELPAYAQNWSVSLLPFRDCDQIKACNPLKLREYLSTGTPIVSTDFPALDGYRDVVSVANTAEGFAKALTDQYKTPDCHHTQRYESVAQESWAKRSNMVSSLLAQL